MSNAKTKSSKRRDLSVLLKEGNYNEGQAGYFLGISRSQVKEYYDGKKLLGYRAKHGDREMYSISGQAIYDCVQQYGRPQWKKCKPVEFDPEILVRGPIPPVLDKPEPAPLPPAPPPPVPPIPPGQAEFAFEGPNHQIVFTQRELMIVSNVVSHHVNRVRRGDETPVVVHREDLNYPATIDTFIRKVAAALGDSMNQTKIVATLQ